MRLHGYARSILVAIFGVLAVAGCQTTGTPKAIPTGPVSGAIAFGGEIIPLPDGEFQVVGLIDTSKANWSAERLILVSTTGDVVDRYVSILHQNLLRASRYNLSSSCGNNAFLHSTAVATQSTNNDCWHIRTVSLGLEGAAHPMNRAIDDYVTKHDLYGPSTVIGPRFIRSWGRKKVQVQYLWNPDLFLLDFDGTPATPEEWSKEAIAADPAKAAVLTSLIRWSEEWRNRLDGAGS